MMRIRGVLHNRPVVLLIDSGSTHNFLALDIASQLQIQPSSFEKLSVLVANGVRLECTGKCQQVELQLQGISFLTDYLLPLSGYDAALGAQWLCTLGRISWDFAQLKIEFAINGQPITLQGIATPPDRLVSTGQANRAIRHNGKGFLLQLHAIQLGVEQEGSLDPHPDVEELLQQFDDLFREPVDLPPPRSLDHRIPLTPGSQPINIRPYRYPHFQKNEIERSVSELLSSGVIRPRVSPYSSPVLLVKKHDGSWRMCVDYRGLNQATIKDKFPIPLIDELLDELHNANYFSKLDLRSGYHQVHMFPADIEKTAFRTHQGHYEFLVMPFGLTNAPSTFQALMNEIFQPLLRKCVLVFFDDILIYSSCSDLHLQHLHSVFSLVRKHQLVLRRDKCCFFQNEVAYLGHIISSKGVAVDPAKINSMTAWPTPTTPKALRGFLGLTGYYRKFIRDYGHIARPLTHILRKDGFHWIFIEEATFSSLKDAMTKAPVLVLPDFSKPFVVECDASGTNISAVLMQGGRPICFFNKALQGRNMKLSAYDREMLALVTAVQCWRPYLLGSKFVVRTDHQSLRFLWEQTINTEA
ncbi:hypothetical protein Dimus_038348 [Dionaea muscipula]